MSFRKYGGINYAPTNNITKNRYSTSENLQENPEIKLKFTDQQVEIYVKADCANYINTDRTENITFDGKTFNLYSTSIVKHYQNNTFYVYFLKETR